MALGGIEAADHGTVGATGTAIDSARVTVVGEEGGAGEDGVLSAFGVRGVEAAAIVEEAVFDFEQAQAPEGEVGEFEVESVEDGVVAGWGEAPGFGFELVMPGGGEGVFAGEGVVDAGVAG